MAGDTVVQIVSGGQNIEVPLNLEMYQEAQDANLSFSEFVNLKYPTNVERDGTAFAQMMRSSGLYLSEDRNFGIRPPTLGAIFNGGAQLNGGAIVRPDGSRSNTPSGRLLFPAVLIDLLESQLRDNKEGYIGMLYDMVAFTRSVNSPKYDQVVIDYSTPQAARGQPISQLTRPNRMLTIRTSEVTRTMPTYSIGMEVSKEALQAATLDLIGLAVREHAIEERAAALDRDLTNMVNGDVDSGYSALSSITAQSLDAAIVAAGNLTQKAWVKYLRRKWRKRNVTHVILDIDTYLAVEGRTNRPTKEQEAGQDERINAVPRAMNPGVPGGIGMFITETSLFGANTMVGIDKSKAIRRIVYSGADYSAIEEFVMRKSTAMRIDWSERLERAGYDEAFDKMTLTV